MDYNKLNKINNISDLFQKNLKELKQLHQSLDLDNSEELKLYDYLNDVISGLTIRINQIKFVYEENFYNNIKAAI